MAGKLPGGQSKNDTVAAKQRCVFAGVVDEPIAALIRPDKNCFSIHQLPSSFPLFFSLSHVKGVARESAASRFNSNRKKEFMKTRIKLRSLLSRNRTVKSATVSLLITVLGIGLAFSLLPISFLRKMQPRKAKTN
ncbi:MAG TPA: hypothetical protein PKC13_23430 [Blastocatellia bacterium]|nr:hypothetical protein [Blastocatellia bacterium]HMY73694.1 hypothetical protein [Blastocatellia bacterium]